MKVLLFASAMLVAAGDAMQLTPLPDYLPLELAQVDAYATGMGMGMEGDLSV